MKKKTIIKACNQYELKFNHCKWTIFYGRFLETHEFIRSMFIFFLISCYLSVPMPIPNDFLRNSHFNEGKRRKNNHKVKEWQRTWASLWRLKFKLLGFSTENQIQTDSILFVKSISHGFFHSVSHYHQSAATLIVDDQM